MKIVTKVVRACRSAMAIKDTKEADLWPFDLQILLALRLQDVQDDRDPILIIVTDNALVCIGCIRFNYTTFFLRGLSRLVILKKERLWIEYGRIFAEKECLHLDKLDVCILLRVIARQT